MKFTIEGFSQEVAVKLGLDTVDLVLLRWLLDFYNTGIMEMRVFGGKRFFWVRYEYVIEEMPILGLSDKTSLGRRLKRMVKSGLLEFKIVQTKFGSRTFYSFNGDRLISLLSKKKKRGMPLDSKVKRVLIQKSSGGCLKSQTLYTDSSITDSSIKDKKRTFSEVVFLTDEEHKQLLDRFGKERVEDLIAQLNDYIQSTGKKYRSHYHTILNFDRMDKNKGLKSPSPTRAGSGTVVTDTFLNERLGRIANRDQIKAVLREIPEAIWWRVDQFLRRRYPASNGAGFAEAERELKIEIQR